MAQSSYELLVGVKLDSGQIDSQLKQIGKERTIKVDDKGLRTVVKEVTKYKDLNGNIIQQTKTLDTENQKLRTSLEKIKYSVNQTKKETEGVKKETEKLNKETKNTVENTKQLNTQSKKLHQSFLDIVGKVGKFYFATMPIQAFMSAITEAKDAIVEFDDALIEFSKVSDLSGDALDNYTQRLGKMGEEVGKSRTQMLESATLFKKTGATEEEAMELARVANIYTNIADEAVSASDSSALLVAMMKAFNIQAEDSISIIDKINEVNYLPSP